MNKIILILCISFLCINSSYAGGCFSPKYYQNTYTKEIKYLKYDELLFIYFPINYHYEWGFHHSGDCLPDFKDSDKPLKFSNLSFDDKMKIYLNYFFISVPAIIYLISLFLYLKNLKLRYKIWSLLSFIVPIVFFYLITYFFVIS